MMWNNLAKNVSQIQMRAHTMATAMPTTHVYVKSSLLVDHDTFLISATTSCRNCTGLVPVDDFSSAKSFTSCLCHEAAYFVSL